MKIHYTRKQSEKVRKELYEKITQYLYYTTLNIRDKSYWEMFRENVAKYNKKYIWIDWYYDDFDDADIVGEYYKTDEKCFGKMYFRFDKRKDFEKINFEERKTTYEKIKDKIKTKKTTAQ